MSDELVRLRRDCGVASDAYHRAVGQWITVRPRSKGHSDQCLALAEIYGGALERLLACLRGLEPDADVSEEIARAELYREFLALDMSLSY